MTSSTQLSLLGKVGFILGWVCFGIAFIAAAGESALGDGFITSANDVLLAAMPGKWIAFKVRHASFIFDTFILPIFHLPGWLIAGLPAGLLLWTCRPHRETIDPELYDSLTTFDRLAEMAKEDGALDDDPTFSEYNMADYDDGHSQDDMPSAKDYMDNWEPESATQEPNPPRALSPQEKMDKARDALSIPFDKLS